VLSADGIVNKSGLRFLNEFVRHKVLDLIGDFSLLGMSFIGHIVAERSGHALHTRLVQQILEQPEKWVLLNSNPLVKEKKPALQLACLQPSIALQAS
jgi:UDP-3-O-[3-hydroxymyristoyl] N-acetylglucosamine deacetylase